MTLLVATQGEVRADEELQGSAEQPGVELRRQLRVGAGRGEGGSWKSEEDQTPPDLLVESI